MTAARRRFTQEFKDELCREVINTSKSIKDDLRAGFPEMKGFSLSNLKYMRLFARGWPDRDAIGQQPVFGTR